MPTPKDPYQLLGVTRSATENEIKDAYRKLAKKLHPDLNPGNQEAESRFKEVSYAYELIGTPESRAKFDRGEVDDAAAAAAGGGARGRGPFYHQTQRGAGGPGAGRYSYSFGGQGMDDDLFSSIFGGQGRAGHVSRAGEDALYRMDVELKDAVVGAEREITLPGGKRLAVKIPAGVTDGMRLRFAGQGGPGLNGGPPGDAYVEIQVREDARFRREGDNLVIELPVSITDAVFGAEVRTPTLDSEVLLKIPPRSNSGRKLKLAGKGVLDRRGGKRGDQIVVLKVMLPETIDAELEQALRSWQLRQAGGNDGGAAA